MNLDSCSVLDMELEYFKDNVAKQRTSSALLLDTEVFWLRLTSDVEYINQIE